MNKKLEARVDAAILVARANTTLDEEGLAALREGLLEQFKEEEKELKRAKWKAKKQEKLEEDGLDPSINWSERHDITIPTCTTAKQYKAWRALSPRKDGAGKAGFCTDCTPQYQHDCLVGDCCDHPEVVFAYDEDGLLAGTHHVSSTSNKEIITYKKWKQMEAEGLL